MFAVAASLLCDDYYTNDSPLLMDISILQSQKTAKLLMPPPRAKGRMTSSTYNVTGNMKTRNNRPSSTIETNKRARYNPSTSSTSDDIGRSRSRPSSSTSYENIKSSVSDGPLQQTKPKRKRRPKKKKT